MRKGTYYQNYDIPKNLSNPELRKIIDFYLFNTPVSGTSVRGKKFSDYGFKGVKAFARLKTELLNSATESLKFNYCPCSKEGLGKIFDSISAVSPPNEYCVFLKRDEKTVMESLFAAIRNALAHGSFNVKSYDGIRIYFFLNFNSYKKAQIVLQEKTLLAWIKIIQSGYDPVHK